jgi:aryl-alcohol dehydrogenase-like predicted oxidoreductase
MQADLPGICLGGNVFGWTADRAQSFEVLDAAHELGLTFLDTADAYSAWAHGGVGGQSESIIGDWMAAHGTREHTVLMTKVGWMPGCEGIRPDTIRRGIHDSLRRLRTDYVDIYFAHMDDGGDLAETFGAFSELTRQGKTRAVGISNFTAARLAEALEVCARDGLAMPTMLQPNYSLMERGYEADARPIAEEYALAVTPYYALAKGFLTGKYRPDGKPVASTRADDARSYLSNPCGVRVLDALAAVASAHQVSPASVALAWLHAQPTVTAPIASARTVAQLAPLAQAMEIELTAAELAALDAASGSVAATP